MKSFLKVLIGGFMAFHGPTRRWAMDRVNDISTIAITCFIFALIFLILGIAPFWLAILVSFLPLIIFGGAYVIWLVNPMSEIGAWFDANYGVNLPHTQIIIRIILLFLLPVSFMFLGSRVFTGLAFLLTIILFMAAYAPIGVARKVFGSAIVRSQGVFTGIKLTVGYLAIAGWVAMMYPTALTLVVILIVVFAGLVLAIFSKVTIIDKFIVPIVFILTIIAGVREVFPDSYGAGNRWLGSVRKMGISYTHRQSAMNEGTATSNFAKPIKDIILYNFNPSGNRMANSGLVWSKDSLLRIPDPQDTGRTVNGLLFLKVQVPKNGSFIEGDEYWVEADLINIATRRSLLTDKADSYKDTVRTTIVVMKDSLGIKDYYAGDKPYFKLGAGETSQRIRVPGNSKILCDIFASGDYIIVPEGGQPVYVKHKTPPPIPRGTVFTIKAPSSHEVTLELDVS